MAVPKRKTSKARRDRRRAHDALDKVTLAVCKTCGEKYLPHHVCMECGTYNEKQIIKLS